MAADPRASIEIDAPLAVIWQVMLDTEAYGEWNPFVVRAETAQPPAVGNPIALSVRWTNGKGTRSPEVITAIEPPATAADGTATALLSYVYAGLPSKLGLVRGTRHQRLTQRPGQPTTYETWEEFSGPLVALAGPGRVAEGFRRHAVALERRVAAITS
jgi:hypothetical protein